MQDSMDKSGLVLKCQTCIKPDLLTKFHIFRRKFYFKLPFALLFLVASLYEQIPELEITEFIVMLHINGFDKAIYQSHI